MAGDLFGTTFPSWMESCNYTQLNSEKEIERAFMMIPAGSPFALDTETTSLDRLKAKILGYSFCAEPGESYWVPVKTGRELAILAKHVKDRICLFYNAKYDIPVLERHNVKIYEFEDVMCLVFLENPNKRMRGLKRAGQEILGLETVELTDFFPKKHANIRFDLLDPTIQRIYGSQDADLTLRLSQHLSHFKIEQPKIWGLEMALIRPVIEMEFNGIDIDADFLRNTSKVAWKKIKEYENEIYGIAGEKFDINSNKQKIRILYDKLGLKCPRKTEKGNPKVDKDTLDMIKERHPILKPLKEIDSLSNNVSSFIDKMPKLIHPDTGRLHCSFIQWHVPTGRFSSRDPNLQNIPKSLTEEEIHSCMNIRAGFVANPTKEANDDPQDNDFKFLDCDYSQVELRVAASLAQEPVWLKAYNEGIDVHSDTARRIYGVETPNETQRGNAKQGNFSILIDITAYTFAQRYGMEVEEAEEFIENWYKALPRLREWKLEEKLRAKRTQYAYTYFGRRRPMFISEKDSINCANLGRRKYWERSVISHEVQGTAADIMKLALILVRKKIDKAGFHNDIFPILTVHDQILFKARMKYLEEAKKVIKDAMEIKIANWVPLKIDMKEGTRWGLCEKVRG